MSESSGGTPWKICEGVLFSNLELSTVTNALTKFVIV